MNRCLSNTPSENARIPKYLLAKVHVRVERSTRLQPPIVYQLHHSPVMILAINVEPQGLEAACSSDALDLPHQRWWLDAGAAGRVRPCL